MIESADSVPDVPVPDVPDVPAYRHESWRSLPTLDAPTGSRAETAANHIARLAAATAPGERIGSKDDLRRLCRVSVGTINEAIKLALARGVVSSRPGPGGGVFAVNPSPLAKMNGWFRTAASSEKSLNESIRVRDTLAPLLVTEALAQMTQADTDKLATLLAECFAAQQENNLSGVIVAAWGIHEHFAGIGDNSLLDSFYLSIINVGTSHLRDVLAAGTEDGGDVPVWFDEFLAVQAEFVTALRDHDHDAAVDALRRTDPTMLLRPPADAG